MYTFENACQIQLAAQSGGAELGMIAPDILSGTAEAMKVQTSGLGGAFVWPALIRKLNRVDESYLT
jgi:hypothetical protein